MSTAVNERLIRELGDQAVDRIVSAVVATLQAQRAVLSGDDSGLGNVWLEFAVQVQGEQSYDWDFFESHVMQTAEGAMLGLTKLERQALALRTPTGQDWIEEADGDRVPENDEELVDLVYGRLSSVAMDWEDRRLDRYLCRAEDGDEDEDEDEDEDDGNVNAGDDEDGNDGKDRTGTK